jgi:hypothetical protein
MIVFVHQPEYIPWLGFFDKLAQCDVCVIYDDAQYQHGGFHNRNRIRTPQGWEWLTVPISHGYPQTIKNVKIAGDQWKNKHLYRIRHHYQNAPYYSRYYPILKDAIMFNHQSLLGLNLHLIKELAEVLDIKPKMICSSELPYAGTEKNEKLISMCTILGADCYLSGSGGRNYIQEAMFNQAKIKLHWHTYQHPTYKQGFNGFEPNMSIIDLLFNEGPRTREIIQSGGHIEETKKTETALTPLIIERSSV